MDEAKRLAEGVAVVTGAGSGLGRALALELARRGVAVAALGRREAALEETAALAAAAAGPAPPVTTVPADVADPASVAAAFERIDRLGRPVTILLNNAAIYERFDFVEAPPERTLRTFATNLDGVVLCAHAALRRMVEPGFGRIVNVTTFAGDAPVAGSLAYSASKGAIRLFSRALVAEVGDRFPDIVITDWVPGVLATSMGTPEGLDPDEAARWGVALALAHERTLTGALFARDREVRPPRSLKGRVKDLLIGRPPPPRRLAPPSG